MYSLGVFNRWTLPNLSTGIKIDSRAEQKEMEKSKIKPTRTDGINNFLVVTEL